MEAPELVDFGMDGLIRWARKNQLTTATIEYTNGAVFTAVWRHLPAQPGRRESLSLWADDHSRSARS